MKKPYECSVCGRQNIKLWRPYMGTEPLICAKCAEERQTPFMYDEHTWKKEGVKYVGTPTGKKLPLPKWKVNEKGLVPTYDGPGPEELPRAMTDQLVVNLRDVSDSYSSGETTMVPAVPDGAGNFWSYTADPKGCGKWWKDLPIE